MSLREAVANATITILGSGTSTGVPVIGCPCATCASADPRDKRLRASILLKLDDGQAGQDGSTLVIDTGPDFRQQMLRAGVKRLEHVLYTHTHADHCHGFDDLRAFYFQQRQPVICHMAEPHVVDFKARFAYAFEDTGYVGTRPQVTLAPFGNGPFAIGGLTVDPAMVPHGHMRTAAFRFGRFAYATDFKAFPAELEARWRGKIDVMVASGIHFAAHPTHSSVGETAALFGRLGVKRGIITHLAHAVLHARDGAALPPGVELATDGLSFSVSL